MYVDGEGHTAGVGELDGVAHEVDEDLADAARVALDRVTALIGYLQL